MSVSAIVVMLVSIVVLWGVAGWAFVTSLRQEERKAALATSQGGCEPFSPRAFRDLEHAMQDTSMPAERMNEMRQARAEQLEALSNYDHRFYEWSDRDLAQWRHGDG